MEVTAQEVRTPTLTLPEGEYMKVIKLFAGNRIKELGDKHTKLGYILATSDGDALIRVWDGNAFIGSIHHAHAFGTKKEATNLMRELERSTE